MKGERWIMERGSGIWQKMTVFCFGRPFTLLGWAIGLLLFLLIIAPSGSDISLWHSDQPAKAALHHEQPTIFQLVYYIKEGD